MNPTEIILQSSQTHLIKPKEIEQTKRFILEQHAPSTRDMYRSDYEIFQAWCMAHGLPAVPAAPETVAMFLAAQAEEGKTYSTIKRRMAAIRYAHTTQRVDSPTKSEYVRATLAGIRRTINVAAKQKAPATIDRLQQMIVHCSPTLTGIRDKALLLLCFSGAFRRSEIVALEVQDLQEVPEGFRVTIRKSKTDQEGAGHIIAIYRGTHLKVIDAVKAWMMAAQIQSGPLFRRIRKNGLVGTTALNDKTIARLVKDYALKAGFDPQEFAGHSLRAGFLTSAAEAGASIFKMMEVSRHKSVDTLKGYVRNAELFKNHAGARFL